MQESEVGTQMKGENRAHRDHTLNPRRWPRGLNTVPYGPHRIETKGVSQLSGEERDLIYYLATIAPSGDIANLGHANGGSAVLFAKAQTSRNKSNKVYSVDLFETPSKWRRARQRLVDYGVRDTVVPCRGYTQEWGEKFRSEGREFSVIFIDADHTYEHVKEDSDTWRPMLCHNGLLAFHDTHQEFSHNAIRDSVEQDPRFKEEKNLHVDTIRVFRRVQI